MFSLSLISKCTTVHWEKPTDCHSYTALEERFLIAGWTQSSEQQHPANGSFSHPPPAHKFPHYRRRGALYVQHKQHTAQQPHSEQQRIVQLPRLAHIHTFTYMRTHHNLVGGCERKHGRRQADPVWAQLQSQSAGEDKWGAFTGKAKVANTHRSHSTPQDSQ